MSIVLAELGFASSIRGLCPLWFHYPITEDFYCCHSYGNVPHLVDLPGAGTNIWPINSLRLTINFAACPQGSSTPRNHTERIEGSAGSAGTQVRVTLAYRIG